MSDPQSSSERASELDLRLTDLLQAIRAGVLHLLRPDQSDPPLPAHLHLGMETLKSTADTTWLLAEKQRLWAETEKVKAYTEQLKAETEKIKAEKS